jgi:hypothetical protein
MMENRRRRLALRGVETEINLGSHVRQRTVPLGVAVIAYAITSPVFDERSASLYTFLEAL